MFETIEKIWGTRTRLLETESVVLDRLCIKKGGYCSIHIHEYKNNQFYIEKGTLQLEYFNNKSLKIVSPIASNMIVIFEDELSIVIKPGIAHRFIGVEESIVYEIITNINVMESDIERICDAGVV